MPPFNADLIIAEQLRFEKHVGSVLLQAISESGKSFEEIDQLIGSTPGTTKDYLNHLIKGTAGIAAHLIVIGFTLDVRLNLAMNPITPKPEKFPEGTL